MLLPKRPVRYLVLGLVTLGLTLLYYTTLQPQSKLSENANPENEKDMNGNTKAPDLATGVGEVIDSHRLEGRDDFDFPKIVHQTARKNAPTPATLSWYYANPGEEHMYYSDKDALAYVKKVASSELYEIYHDLPDPVARADLFRYIVLYEEGGAYADVDTTTLCPLNAWIPEKFDVSTLELVIGVEVDAPSVTKQAKIEEWQWSGNFQLVQYTMMAKPKHAALKAVIKEASNRIQALAKSRSEEVEDLTLSALDIIKTTGPGAFTAAILEYLDLSDDFTSLRGLSKPVQIKDVLIMPVSAFAPNQRHSASKSVTNALNIPEILVMHEFQSTDTWVDNAKSWLSSKVN